MNRLLRFFSVWNVVFLLAIVVLFLLVVYPMYSIFQASFISAETGSLFRVISATLPLRM